MYCAECNRHFATKYTYKRHMDLLHNQLNGSQLDQSQSDTTDVISDDGHTDSVDQDSMEQDPVDKESEEESEPDDESDAESEDGDFWTLLVREAVKTVLNRSNGEPLQDVTNVEQITEGKKLVNFMNIMKNKFHSSKCIIDASEGDKLMDMIQEDIDEITDKLDDGDGAMEKHAADTVWKKYKLLVKKKIQDNLDELEPLVGGEELSDEDDRGVEKGY
jgi:hypothetical protein